MGSPPKRMHMVKKKNMNRFLWDVLWCGSFSLRRQQKAAETEEGTVQIQEGEHPLSLASFGEADSWVASGDATIPIGMQVTGKREGSGEGGFSNVPLPPRFLKVQWRQVKIPPVWPLLASSRLPPFQTPTSNTSLERRMEALRWVGHFLLLRLLLSFAWWGVLRNQRVFST